MEGLPAPTFKLGLKITPVAQWVGGWGPAEENLNPMKPNC